MSVFLFVFVSLVWKSSRYASNTPSSLLTGPQFGLSFPGGHDALANSEHSPLLFFSLFCFLVSNSSPLKTALNLQVQPQPPWVSEEHISKFYIRCSAGVSQTALYHLWHVNDSCYPRLLLPSNPPNASFKPQILFETSLSRSNSCQVLEIVSQGLSQLCSPPPPSPKLSFN